MLVKCLCGTSIAIESRHLGNKIACPQCNRQLRVASGNSDPGTTAPASDSNVRVTPTISDSNPLPKTQPPKINTMSDDLPLRLRAPAKITRESSGGYYRPRPKQKSNETFKFLTVCAVFLIGLCILGGFGLVGLAIYKQNPPVVADKENPDLSDPGDPQNPKQTDLASKPSPSAVPPNPTPPDNNWSPSSSTLSKAGVRSHSKDRGNGLPGAVRPRNSTPVIPKISDRPATSGSTSNSTPTTAPQTGSGTTSPSDKSPETIIKGNGESFELDSEESVARSFATGGLSIMGIQISPDKKYLGANSLEGVVYVFDLTEGGKLLYKIVPQQKLIRAIAFSDATSLYTLGDQESLGDSCIAIRNPQDGSRTQVSIGEAGTKRASSLAVSTDGRSVFAHWQKALGESTSSFSYQDAKFWRFSAIGDEVKVFDLQSVFRDATTFRSKLPSCSTFTRDGRMLINGFEDGWIGGSSGTGGEIAIVASKRLHNGPVSDIAISPDGEKMISGSEDGAIQLTSLKSSSWSSKTLNRDSSAGDVLGVAFSSDNSMVAASLANRTVEIYNADSRKLVKTLRPPSLCTDLEFMGKDQFLVAGGKDGKIRILPIGAK